MRWMRASQVLVMALAAPWAALGQTPGRYGYKQPLASAQLNADLAGKADANHGMLIAPRINLDDGVTPLATFGNGGDASYSPRGYVVPFGGIHGRSAMAGCQDQGVAHSAIADTAMLGSNNGLAFHSAFNGGCAGGAASLTSYGSFDGGAVFEQAGSSYPGITLANVSYDTTHANFSTPLTAQQQQALSPYTYVLTNSIGPHGAPIGSYLLSWTATTLTTVGWYELGYGAAGSPLRPTATYQAGTPAAPTVYLGQPTNTFTRNEVCDKQPGTLPFVHAQCSEVDVVNNTGADTDAVSGYDILHMGANGGGTGMNIGSTAGFANAFGTLLALHFFKSNGLTLEQVPGLGGVGLTITMDGGLPFVIRNHANVFAFSVDGASGNVYAGADLVRAGAAIENNAMPAPPGLTRGAYVRTQSRSVMAVVPAGQAIPAASPAALTFDGGQAVVAGANAFALPGTASASHRMEAHLTANALDASGTIQAMSGTVRWTVKQGSGGAAGGLVASGPALATAEQVDAYFSAQNCGFSAQAYGASIVPIFFCTAGPLAQQVTIGGTMELVTGAPN